MLTAVLVSVALLLIAAGTGYVIALKRFQASGKSHRLTADVQPLVVRLYETGSVRVMMERQFRWRGPWVPEPATFLVRSQKEAVFAVDPVRGGTSTDAPAIAFRVTGTRIGEGTFRLSATPAGLNQACMTDLIVRVDPNPENRSHIRVTAEALKASLRHS